MPDPHEQAKPVGPDRRAVERSTTTAITARQLVQAADSINASLQEITGNIHDLQACLRSGDGLDTSLIMLKDRSERMETNIATLQQTVNLVVDRVNDPKTREKEFLGSLLAVTLDVGDTLETVKEALISLTQQVQGDQQTTGCAWRAYLAHIDLPDGAVIFGDITKISRLADRLDTMVREDLKGRGFDPDTGKRREWFYVQLDKLRSAASNLVIGVIAFGALSGVTWLWQHYSAQSEVTRLREDLARVVQHYEAEEKIKDVVNQQLRDELAKVKGPKQR